MIFLEMQMTVYCGYFEIKSTWNCLKVGNWSQNIRPISEFIVNFYIFTEYKFMLSLMNAEIKQCIIN